MELLFGPNFGPYLIPNEPTANLMREQPELIPLLSRATALFYLQNKGWEQAVQVFEDAHASSRRPSGCGK